jgi:penicillin-binding protein 1B
LLQVTGLYQTLAAGGFRSPPRAIRSVLDAENRHLNHFALDLERATDSQTAYLLQNALIQVGRYGSARPARRALGESFVFAGKTGTSSEQRDSWFAGYTGDLLAVVWVGRDDNAPTAVTGAGGALPVWTRFMQLASRQPLATPPPPGIELEWIDAGSGQLSRPSCASALEVAFVTGTAPQGSRVCGSP